VTNIDLKTGKPFHGGQ